MRVLIAILLTAGLWTEVGAAARGAGALDAALVPLAGQAVSTNRATAQAAIDQLRAAGPMGLDTLLHVHRGPLYEGSPIDADRLARLNAAIDAVAGQRDARTSGLYWHTDLEAAKAAARESGKPILSLRLLGKLTDEFSCANSRYFRTTLYANQQVSTQLRENFVLYWQSERPVPKVTIDFGDGRKLERTLTGNSIHYVLDANGRPIEAIPGLYGPGAFQKNLQRAAELNAQLVQAGPNQRTGILNAYHRERGNQLDEELRRDLRQVGQPLDRPQPSLTRDDELWAKVARLHHSDAELDAGSLALMRAQNPPAQAAGERAFGKSIGENPLVAMVRNFQNAVAIDTVRNEYVLHRKIHEWMASGVGAINDLNALNQRVYRDLFLTPASDPYLGLVPSGVYTGLEGNGIVQTPPTGR